MRKNYLSISVVLDFFFMFYTKSFPRSEYTLKIDIIIWAFKGPCTHIMFTRWMWSYLIMRYHEGKVRYFDFCLLFFIFFFFFFFFIFFGRVMIHTLLQHNQKSDVIKLNPIVFGFSELITSQREDKCINQILKKQVVDAWHIAPFNVKTLCKKIEENRSKTIIVAFLNKLQYAVYWEVAW